MRALNLRKTMKAVQKTFTAKPKEIERKWFIIDAEDVVLGRLAAEVAKILRGKHKPTFTPNIDTGDHVVIITADKIRLTGNKITSKKYYWHTGFPGGIKETTPNKLFGKKPTKVVELAIKRMISRNPLGTQQMRKLKVYAGTEHPHAAQNPEVLDLAAKNKKNKRVED